MDLKTLMATKPNDLALLQFRELRDHTISILESVVKHIYNHNFDEVEKYLVFSPAGDGYGSDNHFINFSYMSQDNPDNAMDLQEIIDTLRELHKQVNNK